MIDSDSYQQERIDVSKELFRLIMRTGTTEDGNTLEASIAYEALAYLEGERTLEDFYKIKLLRREK